MEQLLFTFERKKSRSKKERIEAIKKLWEMLQTTTTDKTLSENQGENRTGICMK